jgi:integrase/recombinase XerC
VVTPLQTPTSFATRTGAALDRQAAHKMIKRVLKRAGLPEDISAHWLRHSHATHVLQRGGNIADLQKQLGHSSLATTSRYAHETAFSADALAI